VIDDEDQLYIVREELQKPGRRKRQYGRMKDRRETAVWEYCPLTAREVEVLQLASEGLTNDGIASELGVSKGAVVWFIQEARKKIGLRPSPRGANAAVQMVAIAMREGWIQ
jgi:DNA-binding NarL/FixJ family response regulator